MRLDDFNVSSIKTANFSCSRIKDVIPGINTMSDISKLSQISLA